MYILVYTQGRRQTQSDLGRMASCTRITWICINTTNEHGYTRTTWIQWELLHGAHEQKLESKKKIDEKEKKKREKIRRI